MSQHKPKPQTPQTTLPTQLHEGSMRQIVDNIINISIKQSMIRNQKFFHNTLEAVIQNQELCKQYWSKRVYCTASGASWTPNYWVFRGEYHCCDTKGWIDFSFVEYEKCPPKDDQFLTGRCSVEFCHYIIDEIKLIDVENKENDENAIECFGKSIKNELFDVVRLKMIQNALYKMSYLYPEFEPFDIKYRKQYFKASTKDSIKRQIADNILNIKIPQNLEINPVFTTAFQSAIYDTAYIEKTGIPNYNLCGALSLLHHYHQLWIQCIKKNDNFEEKEMEIELKRKFDQSYMNWDHYKCDLEQKPTFWYQMYNSQNAMDPPIYSKNMVHLRWNVPITMNTVYIESIWPYYFVGVCSKLKKNNQDWRCMKCLKESTAPFGYMNMNMMQTAEKSEDKIFFYKAKRTDITMEICDLCIRTLLHSQQWQQGLRKCNKVSKRKDKRMKKKLDKYQREGIDYTPPTSVLGGIQYYGMPMGTVPRGRPPMIGISTMMPPMIAQHPLI